MPRPKKCRRICALPRCSSFGPLEGAADGRVEMEVQGEPEKIERLVARLKEGTFIVIDSMTMADVPLKEGEGEFRVFS